MDEKEKALQYYKKAKAYAEFQRKKNEIYKKYCTLYLAPDKQSALEKELAELKAEIYRAHGITD